MKRAILITGLCLTSLVPLLLAEPAHACLRAKNNPNGMPPAIRVKSLGNEAEADGGEAGAGEVMAEIVITNLYTHAVTAGQSFCACGFNLPDLAAVASFVSLTVLDDTVSPPQEIPAGGSSPAFVFTPDPATATSIDQDDTFDAGKGARQFNGYLPLSR